MKTIAAIVGAAALALIVGCSSSGSGSSSSWRTSCVLEAYASYKATVTNASSSAISTDNLGVMFTDGNGVAMQGWGQQLIFSLPSNPDQSYTSFAAGQTLVAHGNTVPAGAHGCQVVTP